MNNLPKSYTIKRDEEGIHYLSLEPLLDDLNTMLQNPQLKDAWHNIEVVKVFVDAMINEARIVEYQQRERDDELSYSETLLQ